MSLKQIIVFLVFALLSIYTAFLNPHDSVVHITQNQSLKLPTVLLLLSSILVGVIITVFMFWTFNFKKAISNWKTSFTNNQIKKKNHKVEALFKKGESFFICGKTDKAKTVAEKVLDVNPEHIGALNLMGRILDVQGHSDQSEVLLKKAIALEPNNIHALNDLVHLYSKADRLHEEIALLQKIQVMNPGTAGPLIQLRDIYAKQENWKKVCVLQKKVLPLLRDNNEEWKKEQANLGQFYFELGKQYLSEGKKDLAISEFKQALRTDDQNLSAYLSLGNTYLENGKEKQALKTWQTGFQKTGHHSCLVHSQTALRESENYQGLLAIYEEAFEASAPDEKSALALLLSTFYLEHGLQEKAQQLLEDNPSEHLLLHSLLLENSKNSENGNQQSQFELTRDAVFALTTGREAK